MRSCSAGVGHAVLLSKSFLNGAVKERRTEEVIKLSNKSFQRHILNMCSKGKEKRRDKDAQLGGRIGEKIYEKGQRPIHEGKRK